MLTTIIILAVIASVLYAGCNVRNAIKRDNLAPNVIPVRYYYHYYLDWLIAIIVLLGVAYGIYWIVNN